MSFPDHVFREYDIRGLFGSEINADFAWQLGQAFAAELQARGVGEPRVLLSMDCRLSGPELKKAVTDGLQQAGCLVLDMGMNPTPLLYFQVFQDEAIDGAIQVTASHNPAPFNGFKIMIGREAVYGTALLALAERMKSQANVAQAQAGTVLFPVQPFPIHAPYLKAMSAALQLKRPLKVVVDAGNGPAGVIAVPLYRSLGCEVVELYCEPDGHFPNHHPDPTVDANMRDLQHAVRAHQADLGLGFDGDGDRLGVVDGQGKIIWGDRLLLVLALDVLQQHPGATIIAEVKCSRKLFEGIAAAGGQPVMWKAGHSLIKAKMKETGALLAGEMSGHIFYADRFPGYDDAIYAGGRLLEIVSRSAASLADLLAPFPALPASPELRIDCADAHKFAVVEAARAHFSQDHTVVDIDGARVAFKEGWGLVRASNTQPSLVLRFEADNEHALQRIQAEMEGWIKNYMSQHGYQ